MNCSPTSAHRVPVCRSRNASVSQAAQLEALIGNLTPPQRQGFTSSDDAWETALRLGQAAPDLAGGSAGWLEPVGGGCGGCGGFGENDGLVGGHDGGLGREWRVGFTIQSCGGEGDGGLPQLKEELDDLFSSMTPAEPLSVAMDDTQDEAVGDVDMSEMFRWLNENGNYPLLPPTSTKGEEAASVAAVVQGQNTGCDDPVFSFPRDAEEPPCMHVKKEEPTGPTAQTHHAPAMKQEQLSPPYLPSPPPQQHQQRQQEECQGMRAQGSKGPAVSRTKAVVRKPRRKSRKRTATVARCNNKRALDARWPERLLATNAYEDEVKPFLATLSKQDLDAFKRARRRYRNRACAERKKKVNPERVLSAGQLQEHRRQLEHTLRKKEAHVRDLQSIVTTLEGALSRSTIPH